jgi:hypothetical protein
MTTKKFNFFPLNSIQYKYIQKLKIDFELLFYNCGLIIGLWFGLSPIQY